MFLLHKLQSGIAKEASFSHSFIKSIVMESWVEGRTHKSKLIFSDESKFRILFGNQGPNEQNFCIKYPYFIGIHLIFYIYGKLNSVLSLTQRLEIDHCVFWISFLGIKLLNLLWSSNLLRYICKDGWTIHSAGGGWVHGRNGWSMRPCSNVYLSIKGVGPWSEERPRWGGGLLPGATQSRPAPLYTGRHG